MRRAIAAAVIRYELDGPYGARSASLPFAEAWGAAAGAMVAEMEAGLRPRGRLDRWRRDAAHWRARAAEVRARVARLEAELAYHEGRAPWPGPPAPAQA